MRGAEAVTDLLTGVADEEVPLGGGEDVPDAAAAGCCCGRRLRLRHPLERARESKQSRRERTEWSGGRGWWWWFDG